MDSSDVSTQPITEAAAYASPQPAIPSPVTPIQAATGAGGEQCPSCQAKMAADQRYCLSCGQRRGDPRLPFMDAVVLMDAIKRPAQAPAPPPSKKGRGISPNAALIAGVATLLLALGIGVLIGRSGNHTVASTPAAPQIVKVQGGGESEGANQAATASTTGGSGKPQPKSKKAKAAALKEANAHPAAAEVLKPAAGVKLPPATIQPGGSCEKGAAGCKNGKFNGNFFE